MAYMECILCTLCNGVQLWYTYVSHVRMYTYKINTIVYKSSDLKHASSSKVLLIIRNNS